MIWYTHDAADWLTGETRKTFATSAFYASDMKMSGQMCSATPVTVQRSTRMDQAVDIDGQDDSPRAQQGHHA